MVLFLYSRQLVPGERHILQLRSDGAVYSRSGGQCPDSQDQGSAAGVCENSGGGGGGETQDNTVHQVRHDHLYMYSTVSFRKILHFYILHSKN